MANKSIREMAASVAKRFSSWESGWAPNGTEVEGPWQRGITVVYKKVGRRGGLIRATIVEVVKPRGAHEFLVGQTVTLNDSASRKMFFK